MQMKESMQVSSLELKEANEMTVYKRHGLHTNAQSPKIKVPHRNEPACTLVPASKLPHRIKVKFNREISKF